jgi:uncharacterized membrane protein
MTSSQSTLSNSDKISSWLSKYYIHLFNLVMFLYVGIAFLAPVLMKFGFTGSARVIYTIYRPLCHQLGFRSFYLFGEQFYYPRALAHVVGVKTFEQITNQNDIDVIAASRYLGNDVVGYKLALCERDIAIYGSMLVFGIIFWLTGRKIKSIHWFLWILIGLIPIAVDGLSQLPSLIAGILPSWILIRESTPFLRVLTGSLFGFTTAWYLYPFVEESMQETRSILTKKQALQKSIDQTIMPHR